MFMTQQRHIHDTHACMLAGLMPAPYYRFRNKKKETKSRIPHVLMYLKTSTDFILN